MHLLAWNHSRQSQSASSPPLPFLAFFVLFLISKEKNAFWGKTILSARNHSRQSQSASASLSSSYQLCERNAFWGKTILKSCPSQGQTSLHRFLWASQAAALLSAAICLFLSSDCLQGLHSPFSAFTIVWVSRPILFLSPWVSSDRNQFVVAWPFPCNVMRSDLLNVWWDLELYISHNNHLKSLKRIWRNEGNVSTPLRSSPGQTSHLKVECSGLQQAPKSLHISSHFVSN